MPLSAPVLRVLGDILDAEKKLVALKTEADALTGSPYTIKLTADPTDLNLAFLDAVEKYKELQAVFDSNQLQIKADDRDAMATFTKLAVEYEALSALLNKGLTSGLNDRQIMQAIAGTAALTQRVDGLKTSLEDAATEAEVAGDVFARTFMRDVAGWGGLLGHVNLFGGATGLPAFLTSIPGWHLALDAGLEIAAVWVPALIALGAAATGAAPVVADLYKELSNVDVVAQATGGKIGYMNGAVAGSVGSFQGLQNAMKPGVVELFGDALDVLGRKTGIFATIALGTEHVLDQWGAQITNALNSGAGQAFLKNSVSDFRQLGNSLGFFFQDIGKIVSEMPGVAHVLLDFGSGALQAAGHVLDLLSPVTKVGLAMHGAIIWGGLLATVLIRLWQSAIEPLAMAVAGKLIPAFALLSAGDFSNFFGGIADMIGPVGLAIGGITALATALYAADKSATAFGTTLQSRLNNASLGNLSATLATTLAQGKAVETAIGHIFGMSPASNVTGPVNTVEREQANYRSNLAALAHQFGGLHNAMDLATQAGISSNQMMSSGAHNLATMRQQIQGLISGYAGMGQSTGTLGNDLAVLNKQTTDQYTNMQKLNSAWDQQISDVTGSQNALDTYLQGLTTLQASGEKVHLTLGKLSDAFTLQHAAIDGLRPSDVALNQAFQTQISNANALIDTYRTAGLATSDFKGAVAASIEPLLKYANGSQSATAELTALAEEAGYDGPAQMKQLTAWLGNGANATLKLKQAANEATIQEALLTGAMQNQGSAITSSLLGQLNAAEIRYSNVAGDVTAYGKAIAQSGVASNAAASARTRLIDDITKMGLQTHSTTGQIAAMITKLLDIPSRLAIQMVLNAEASVSIQERINAISSGAGPGHHLTNFASGGLVPAGFPNDSYLALLSSHEAVVPAHLTPSVAPFLASHGVPGFASGFVPAAMASHSSYTGGDVHNHTWNIQGDSDPQGAAKRIHATMRRYKQSTGGQKLGLD